MMYRLVLTIAAGSALMAQTPSQIAPFTGIEVQNGGHVVVRPGSVHRVLVPPGLRDCTHLAVRDGVLVISEPRHECPADYRVEIEVTTPSLNRVAFGNGGWVRVVGDFPRLDELTVRVGQGGTADVRAIVADRVTASVAQGGRILTVPRSSLAASVNNGGAIIYWGDPRVTSSTHKGGVVERGEPGEVTALLHDVGTPVMHVHRKRKR